MRRPVVRSVVAVAILLAPAAVAACGGSGGAPQPAPSHSVARPTPVAGAARLAADLRWDFRVAHVPGYRIERERIRSGQDQTAAIFGRGGDQIGGMRVDARGVRPSATIGRMVDAQRVRVAGQRGRFGMTGNGTALVWRYAPDSYAMIWFDHEGRNELPPNSHSAAAAHDRRVGLHIARSTTIGPAERIGIDFTLGYLPAGLRYDRLDYEADPLDVPSFDIGFVDSLPGVATDAGQALWISSGHVPDGPRISARSGRVGDHRTRYGPGFLEVLYPVNLDLYIEVDTRHLKKYPQSELVRIAGAATLVGNPSHPSTWADARDALPH